ncbi:uncharacterized protein LOC128252452 [Drosophila gunungcola]|uniref:uncharacterized protein LOC128252452 n=1 Tax=Drosophila gunungcola TaxID=103775 RepID=UPI0022DEC83B|nr:uncharacterized protein LOC128252452 [Drosophila gunungcola]
MRCQPIFWLSALALFTAPSEAQFYPLAAAGPVLDALPRLVVYNPFGGQQLEPLRYGARRAPVNGNVVQLPQLWQPCSCSDFTCRCCLGMAFGLGEALNQRLCAALEYSRADLGMRLSVELNQRTVANLGFSARNPPDYCLPLLLPLPLFSCLRLYDIRAFGEGNMQVCLSVVFKVLASQFFEYRFNCLRFGANGVFFVRDALQDQEQDQEQDQDQNPVELVSEQLNNKLADGSSFSSYAQ